METEINTNQEKRVHLSDVKTGEQCVIVKLHGHGSFRHRLMEMGFVRGEKVRVLKNAPLSDPIEYEIMQSHVSLRRSEAEQIEVVTQEELQRLYIEKAQQSDGTFEENAELSLKHIEGTSKNSITVALVGNPNCGKTSFFNHATGLREKVGNYGGVTVDIKVGTFHRNGYVINLVDLPGTYSLTAFSSEEMYVRQYLTTQNPDVILDIVDASNLERNLLLTTQLIDMNHRVVMALNMYDELEKKGDTLDYKALETMLGFPIIPTSAHKGIGINEVLDSIIGVFEEQNGKTKHIHINYGANIETAIDEVKKVILPHKDITDRFTPRYLSIKLLENDSVVLEHLKSQSDYEQMLKVAAENREKLEKEYQEDISSIISNAKYGFIKGALRETFVEGNHKERLAYSVDNVLTHRWLGFPVLIFFLWLMFQVTFTLGNYPMEWIEAGISALGELARNMMPEGPLTDMIVDGIIGGVGGVIVFLPNIIILFLFISLMEDTGYMARAAFLMDKLMHGVGLHGKAFIPLLMGFGCGVPAIMGTRILESRKDRITTMLAVPFMSCSARLPVYLLFVGAFFQHNHPGLVMLSLYLIGVLFAIITALLLKRTVFKGESDQFVMELPPYRIPTLRNALVHMWDKSVLYLKKMGTVILLASIIIWALQYFPTHNENTNQYDAQIEELAANTSISEEEKEEQMGTLNLLRANAQTEGSYMGQLGKCIEPVFRPLGFDWKMSASILTGAAAKEVIVASMGILYQAGEDVDEESEELVTALKTQKYTSGDKVGQNVFTPVVAYAFMLFVLLYFPCIAALTAIAKEAGWKWMLFCVIYTTIIAWIMTFLFYQCFGAGNWQTIVIGLIVAIIIILASVRLYKIAKGKAGGCASCGKTSGKNGCCSSCK